MADPFIITGTVAPAGNLDRAGVTIQAFDRDMPSVERRAGSVPQPLGEATADAEGRFQIVAAPERFESGEGVSPFRRSREKNPDLSFSAIDRARQPLRIRSVEALNRGFGPDQIIFNASSPFEVTIVVEAVSDAGVSEYEQLLALLDPAIADVPLADLADDDLVFLVSELGLDEQRDVQQRIEWLRAAAGMARASGLPADAFYAWARTNLPDLWAELRPGLDEDTRIGITSKVLGELAVTPRESLVSHLLQAVEGRIVPVRIRERAESLADAVRRRAQTAHTARLRLVRDATGEPLAGRSVTVFDIDANNRDMGTDVTDAQGQLDVTLFADAGATDLNLRVRVSGPSVPVEVMARVPVDTDVVIAVRVPGTDAAPALGSLRDRLAVPDALLQRLDERHQIRTFADIRRRGGLAALDGDALNGIDPAAVARLDSLADLDRLSDDLTETTALLDRRYGSVAAIAYASRKELVAAMTGADAVVTERRAIALHVAATAQVEVLAQILAGRVADLANGIPPPTPGSDGDPLPPASSGDEQHG